MTRRSSSYSERADGLFGPTFVTDRFAERTGLRAWLAAMLDFEAALARAQADTGVLDRQTAERIARECVPEGFAPDSIAARAAESATPVIPLVRDLAERLPPEVASRVHWGATSQDVVDTAAMLVARRSLDLVLEELHGVADECARLGREYRDTLMTGRTLLQQALPTTFGRKAAGWLTGVVESAEALARVRRHRLAVQLGGPVGTLATLGNEGDRVVSALADRLGLAEPVLPWHTDRTRVGELASALGTVAGTLGKIAVDVELGAQTELGELAEGNPGGSSAMPHKRNPVRAVRVTAATRRVPGLVATLLGAMPQEHERGVGSWQSEWEPFTDLLRLTGSAATLTRELLAELRVDTTAMRTNLDLTGGALLSERVSTELAPHLGARRSERLVSELAGRARGNAGGLRAELLDDPTVRSVLSQERVTELTDPGGYLGSSERFLGRALEAYTRWKETTTGDPGL
ncbi:3-carboxy-cis,cis-muconate cycloisomerase [Actinopolyspora mortivallis]|uniref:3-carboxy-cis,cis-muconate cycloisomerase n=1 Tax=Actinopolyspora mortivallis TaxID=33906 RepID=UPI00035FEDAA|nr:3-carboxy-cis,cis-muconate cycloisomerase [Actinopolyspora mortivallis]